MKQIRNRLTYANVMSSLAVFLILGGATAFAAVKKIGANEIKANSIKTGKIVKEAVTEGKIKNLAVTEGKLADGAVTTNKLADNAVTTPKIAKEAVTSEKIAKEAVTEEKLKTDAVTNSKLANNAVNTAELTAGAVKASKLGTLTTRSTEASLATGTTALVTATCQAGERAISGGGVWGIGFNNTTASQVHVVHSFPSGTTAWATRVYNGTASTATFTANVVCLQAG